MVSCKSHEVCPAYTKIEKTKTVESSDAPSLDKNENFTKLTWKIH